MKSAGVTPVFRKEDRTKEDTLCCLIADEGGVLVRGGGREKSPKPNSRGWVRLE